MMQKISCKRRMPGGCGPLKEGYQIRRIGTGQGIRAHHWCPRAWWRMWMSKQIFYCKVTFMLVLTMPLAEVTIIL